MIENFLIPERTVIAAKGEGQPFDISAAQSRVFLLSLKITQIVEQESIDIGIFTSADGATWDAKPVATFPQRFYTGETPFLLDLTNNQGAKFVRAQWDVSRWGRGPQEPRFELGLTLREVPSEILAEVQKEAATRR